MSRPAARALALLGITGLAALAAGLSGPGASAEGDPVGSEPEELVIGAVTQRPLESGEGRLMRAGGISSVRFWLPWSQVESERDEFDWSEPDAAVRGLVEEGLTPLPFLYGTPEWAAERDGSPCSRDDCITYPPVSTSTRYAFARFAAAAAGRYGPDGRFWEIHPELAYRPVRVWQIWNEANLQSFHRPVVNPSAYAAVVRVVANEIRATDPEAEILLAGLFGSRSNGKRWSTRSFLRAFYEVPEIAASFDGIAVHPYSPHPRGVFEQIRAARGVAVANDDEVDLWVTEVGWASSGKRREGLVTTRTGQARRLERAFTRFRRNAELWSLRGAFWYAWRDTERGDAVCGWCPAAGLVDREGRTKPAYDRLRGLAGDD